MNTDVTVIGGGPAGLAAALAARRTGAKVLLIEREARLGGILKQCIHDGFGLVRFGEKLTGPEYAERFIEEFEREEIETLLLSFVTAIEKTGDGFRLSIVNREGVRTVNSKTLILATGCRERTAKQVFIHGSRPSGVFTAGTAQHYINLLGQMPSKRCVILGSGDIGLIMARRLTLEGAEVVGVYEAGASPSGLTRNIHQCLDDYNIPLHLSKTVTRVLGRDRLNAVEIASVDERMQPLEGTEEIVECDSLILSVGLIPENELAEGLGVQIDPATKGPVCDEDMMTSVEGVFCCGNALHVNDLVDYVSESGDVAGQAAARFSGSSGCLLELKAGKNLLYAVPQRIDIARSDNRAVIFFRSSRVIKGGSLVMLLDGKEVFSKRFSVIRPPEMERIEYDFRALDLTPESELILEIKEDGNE